MSQHRLIFSGSWIIVCAALAVFPQCGVAGGDVPRYTATRLPLNGFDINNRGQILGWVGPNIYLYDHGKMVDLGVADRAMINNLGQIMVSREEGVDLYEDGGVNPLRLPGLTGAYGINDLGQIWTGMELYADGVLTPVRPDDFQEPFGFSFWMNNKGHFMGRTYRDTIYFGTTADDLHSIPFMGQSFNDNDEIAGFDLDGDGAVCHDGVVTKLGFSGVDLGHAIKINDLGQIIGYDGCMYACGQVVNINDISDTEYYIYDLEGINDNGQIVGSGYLFTPEVPEPMCLSFVGMALAMLSIRRR